MFPRGLPDVRLRRNRTGGTASDRHQTQFGFPRSGEARQQDHPAAAASDRTQSFPVRRCGSSGRSSQSRARLTGLRPAWPRPLCKLRHRPRLRPEQRTRYAVFSRRADRQATHAEAAIQAEPCCPKPDADSPNRKECLPAPMPVVRYGAAQAFFRHCFQ